MSSRLPSNEQVVEAWFRHYSSGLSSVGIKLGLTAPQQSELEHRLIAVCREVAVTDESPDRNGVGGARLDPIKIRWADDQVSVQGDAWRRG